MFEQYTFARAAFSDDGGNLVFIYLQVDAIQYGAVSKSLGDIFEFNQRFRHPATFSCQSVIQSRKFKNSYSPTVITILNYSRFESNSAFIAHTIANSFFCRACD
jgi:hypothetical protein